MNILSYEDILQMPLASDDRPTLKIELEDGRSITITERKDETNGRWVQLGLMNRRYRTVPIKVSAQDANAGQHWSAWFDCA